MIVPEIVKNVTNVQSGTAFHYYKVGLVYYKLGPVYYKAGKLFYYKVGHVLQSRTILFQSGSGIKKWDSYNKVGFNKGYNISLRIND